MHSNPEAKEDGKDLCVSEFETTGISEKETTTRTGLSTSEGDTMHEQETQLAYWLEQLKDSVPAEMLIDYPRPAVLSGKTNVIEFRIDEAVCKSLQAFSQARQITQFVMLLAALRVTHYRLTGFEDAAIGASTADRNQPIKMIGPSVNTQPIRIKIDEKDTFEETVRQVRTVVTQAQANQDVPLERLVSSLLPGPKDTSKNPLIQLVFALHLQDSDEIQLGDIVGELLQANVTSQMDLEFHIFQSVDHLSGQVMFSTDLFELSTIQAMVDVFQEVLRRGIAQPQTPIATLPLTDGIECLNSMGLLEIKRTDYPRESSIIDVFREQVAAYPSAIAVKDTFSQLTYAELDQNSNKVAWWLRARQMSAETLVAVLAPRSCETIVSFLGILKANLAYLPLDTEVPVARLEAILSTISGKRLILLGSKLSVPSLELPNVEIVPISHTLGENEKDEHADAVAQPSASSLAYVIFTSGSTGEPKGVMVEHRGIVRLVKQTNLMAEVPSRPFVAHMSNLAFDGATLEIYMAILNGGIIVCVDLYTVLDMKLLQILFAEQRINTALVTTAFIKQCLSEASDILTGLDVLFVGGDRFDPRDAKEAHSRLNATIYNGYGPTENTTVSTVYMIHNDEHFINGTPIGQAISNSGAYIMDTEQRIVPLGIIGELIVTGDGLARGYTDSTLDTNRFVSVIIKGEIMRAYRTGDRARWRPKDGLIEFFGRIDSQIKIRGHRIEPAEIEHTILSDTSVQDVAIVSRSSEHNQESEMVGFVTASIEQTATDEDISNQVDGWRDHYESAVYNSVDSINEAATGRDFQGWNSMYDGREIDKVEMQEWLNDTITTLLDGKGAGNVLEIGTGTGMILFNLGAGLSSYVGLEPSKSAVAFVNGLIATIPALTNTAHVHIGSATDVGQIDTIDANTAVLNSVVQHFPSLEYLIEVIDCLILLPGMERIFFGDIRSYALYNEFLASQAIELLGEKATKADIQRKIIELEEREEELLIDPTFFVNLTSRFPHRVQHVEILPKRMRATNELSSFRYAAVVHLRHGSEQKMLTHQIDDNLWTDFQSARMDRQALVHFLSNSSGASSAAFANIPNSKIARERCLLESLYRNDEEDLRNMQEGTAWISTALIEARASASLSALDLVQIGEETGFSVELSWARQQSQHGSLDAIFHRLPKSPDNSRVMFKFPREKVNSTKPLASQPLRRLQARQMETQVIKRLKGLLPAYMLPSQIIVLKAMPLNANGKVDRRELQRRARIMPKARRSVTRVSPRNEIETYLCEEAAAMLGTEIGVFDNLFELGGHSLMATRLMARLSRRLHTHISVKDVFDHPVIADLANVIQQGSLPHKPIPSEPYTGPVRQSYAQGRLWFLDQLNLQSSWYIVPMAIRLRGHLDMTALSRAVNALVLRHETLRTTFEEQDGLGMQVVHDTSGSKLRIFDMSNDRSETYLQILDREHTTPFDLKSEPGWRISLLKLGEDENILSIVMHHIISDGWSIDILKRELHHFYVAALRGKDPLSGIESLPIQYRDFAVWQRQEEQVREQEKQLVYWVEQLKDSVPAELLADYPRPALLSGKANVVQLRIDGTIYKNLQAFSQSRQITPYAILFGAFRATHYRLTGSEDAMIGRPIANRNRPELENMIGFFVNTQCIRTVVNEEDTFESLVRKVWTTTVEAHDNQDVPFERIVSALLPGSRDTSKNPLVQLIFALHSQPNLDMIQLGNTTEEAIEVTMTSRMDIEFHLSQRSGYLDGQVRFSADLFELSTIQAMVDVFQEVLRRGLDQSQSQIPIATLPLTDGLEHLKVMGLLDVNRTDYPRESSVVNVFRDQVIAYPEAIAVKDASSQLTYVELDQKSDEVARWLRRRRMPAESLVGVIAPRSCETVFTLLGILKANLAYLPLDTEVPAARLRAILSTIPGDRLVLLGSQLSAPKLALPNLELIPISATLGHNDHVDVGMQPSANSLAYVIFTSGSTGEPKGVMVEHRGIVRLVKQTNLSAGATSRPSVAHVSNLAFDAATLEIYMAILNGGLVVCVDLYTLLDMKLLRALFARQRIHIAFMTTAFIKQCLNEASNVLPGLDVLFIGGEALGAQDAEKARLLFNSKVYNVYGPTENTTFSTFYEMNEVQTRSARGPPVGWSISNSAAYIMDSEQRIASLGVMGELVVAGDGLARGYTNPALDVDRFVELLIDGQLTKAYRTGDRARWRPRDGLIELFGRIDNQIKIRGHRIEPSEIEHTILENTSIKDVAIVLRNSEDREPEMVAFVTTSAEETPNDVVIDNQVRCSEIKIQEIETQVMKRLKLLLPAYMLPSQIILVTEIPLNANGKVDREQLRRRARIVPRSIRQSVERVSPRDKIEKCLCNEAFAVLGMEVGIFDNFFELGGHSLMATRLATRLTRRLDTHVTVKHIFDNPVIADLADIIRQGSVPHKPIAPLPSNVGSVRQSYVQSYAQGRLWFLDQLNLQSSWYIMPIAVRLLGNLQTAALGKALNALVVRHETLRTTFEGQDGVGMQVIHPPSNSELRIFDIHNDNESRSYLQILDQEQKAPFNLKTEPGWRVALLKIREDEHILSIVMHHIIYDGWSIEVLYRELDQFYTLALKGVDPVSTIAPLPIQYRDFSVWQRQEEQVEEQEKQLAYWLAQLKNSVPAEIPIDHARPVLLSGKADTVLLKVEGVVYERLQAFSQSRQMTPFAVLLAAFRATHYRLTGSKDAMIGRPIANRNRPELENMIGFFVNTQCIRIVVEEQDTFESLVGKVWIATTEAHDNQDVPFERIVSAMLPGSRDTSKTPLVQLDFALHSQERLEKLCLGSIKGQALDMTATARTDVEFHLFQCSGYLDGRVLFSTDLFELTTIQAMVDVFQEVLQRGLDEPLTPIATLPFTAGTERLNSMGLLDVKKTDYPRDSSIIDVFREQVAAFPAAIAVKDASSQLTYIELEQKSNELAGWLRGREMAAESVVGVLAPRACETIVSFLGILKANLAYLPLDIEAPTARLETILSTIPGRRLVLLGSRLSVVPKLELPDLELISIKNIACEQQNSSRIEAITLPSATSLAYVIFTSGSTGKPKGVMIEHRGVVRLVTCSPYRQQLPKAPRVAHLSNLAFDVSTLEIYTALLTGGMLLCIDLPTLLDLGALSTLFMQETIQVVNFTPAMLKLCLFSKPIILNDLDILLIGGDRLDSDDARKARAQVRGNVYNAYGPTENTVDSVLYKIANDDLFTSGVPIGRSMDNSGAYVTDPDLKLVTFGVMGELVLTGDGLARGYTDPTLNVDRFVNIVIKGENTRAYRTGDRARWRPKDGMIEFFGRIDDQIKIRGYRIEPAEIEQTILSDPCVQDVAIVVCKSENKESELVGFITTSVEQTATEEDVTNQVHGWRDYHTSQPLQRLQTSQVETRILRRLRDLLPNYMVPLQIITLEKLPLNANGKVDRKELSRRAITASKVLPQPAVRVAPCNETEAIICEELVAVLGRDVGILDDFFILGGHSLMAIKLTDRINKRLNAQISVIDVLHHPVLADLAKYIRVGGPTIRTTIPVIDNNVVDDMFKDLSGLLCKISTSLSHDAPLPVVDREEVYLPSHVFLTGATGYLGTALLHRLLLCGHVRQISVLVRADSLKHAEDRIIQAATIAGWWDSKYCCRISCWLGDLTKTRFGLSDSQWAMLTDASSAKYVHGVIHSGARVHVYSTYEQLRAANVISTMQLVRAIASSCAAKRFVFISTAPEMIYNASDEGERKLRKALSRSNGYVRSKMIAEQLVLRSAKHLTKQRIGVLKPGFIIGNSESGVANVDDYLWRIVAASVLSGCYPAEGDKSWIHISTADSLSNTAVEYLMNTQSNMKMEVSEIPVDAFWSAVNAALPISLVAETSSQWWQLVSKRASEMQWRHPLSTLLSLRTGSDDLENTLGIYSSVRSSEESVSSQAIASVGVAVTQNVKYLLCKGYFSEDRNEGSFEGVFHRTKR